MIVDRVIHRNIIVCYLMKVYRRTVQLFGGMERHLDISIINLPPVYDYELHIDISKSSTPCPLHGCKTDAEFWRQNPVSAVYFGQDWWWAESTTEGTPLVRL